jgi:hypothetical protein
MTELNIAYANVNTEDYEDMPHQPSLKEKEKDNKDLYQQQLQQLQQQQLQQQQLQQQQQQQQLQQQQQTPMRVRQHADTTEKFTNYQQRYPEYSFWDRMVMSRREVLKLFILSIVIILGISLEKIGCHYIMLYINSNDLSTFQELMVRLAFPIIVFIILWIIKSL